MASYPQFIPWCRHIEVLRATPSFIKARTTVGFSFFEESFESYVELMPYKSVRISHKEEGILKRLESVWSFKDLDEGRCEVGFFIDVKLSHILYNALLSGAINRVGEDMVKAFKRRSDSIYGIQSEIQGQNS